VFRDRLVSLAISLIDLPCLNRIDRILLINPMVITPCSPPHKKQQGRSNTLVNFESASPGKSGQFSVGVNRVCGIEVDDGMAWGLPLSPPPADAFAS
jgi:hypothetical protein